MCPKMAVAFANNYMASIENEILLQSVNKGTKAPRGSYSRVADTKSWIGV